MRYRWVGLVLLLGMATSYAAEEAAAPPAPSPEAAEPVLAGPEVVAGEAAITVESAIEAAGDESGKIDLDAIDLDLLYEAIEAQPEEDAIEMSLAECIEIALRQNQEIAVVSFEPLKVDGDIMAAKGEFDPQLAGNMSYSHSETEASSQIQQFGGIAQLESDTSSGSASLGGRTPWGTLYNMAFTIAEDKSTFSAFAEEWSGGLGFTVTQPLLRGFGPKVVQARVRLAKVSRDIAETQVHLSVMNTVAEVVRAYVDLAGAVEQLRVSEESLRNAERLLDVNRKRLEIGTAAALDVLQAKAGLASRQSDYIAARSRIRDAEDRLKQLLDMRDDVRFADVAIRPVTQPVAEDIELSEEAAVAQALEHRPDVRASELEIESSQIEQRRAANDMLPQVDVEGNVFRGGRGPQDDDVFDGITKDEGDLQYGWTINASVPLGNRAARGAYHRAKINVDQSEQRLEQTRQQVILNVRLALRAVETNKVLMESNRQSVALQESNVAAEEKRLELGMTTSYRVLQVQEDLTTAQTQQVQAMINYFKSVVDLWLAEGVLLENLGVAFEPQEPVEPVGFVRSVMPVPVVK